MAAEFYFPQEIINHIQSFLTAKEHAQSSVLSKSWYSSWPTRPVLELKEKSLYREDNVACLRPFLTDATETLNRYKNLKKVDKFMLLLELISLNRLMGMNEFDFSRDNTLVGDLITSASKLGVSEIVLCVSNYSNSNLRYDLPAQVFACRSLIRLYVGSYVIGGVIGNRVLCSRLKSLVLFLVKTTDDVVRNILFGCPLIENLDLYRCVGLDKLNVSKSLNLVEFHVTGTAMRVEFLDLEKTNMTKFHCLRRLHLKKVRISSAEFFTRFGCMFPCIEDMTLGCCGDYEEINISSHSIKRLSLYECEGLMKAQLNVPNITKFKFNSAKNDGISGHQPLPSLSFDNVSRYWESDVVIWWSCDITEACLFMDLRKFLIQLTLSRISVDITFTGKSVVISGAEKIPCFPAIPVVEDLMVCTCGSSKPYPWESLLLLGLSRSCRPKLINDCYCEGK